jgi:hypothetical protein
MEEDEATQPGQLPNLPLSFHLLQIATWHQLARPLLPPPLLLAFRAIVKMELMLTNL